MRLLEHQAKELFRRQGIPVPRGSVCQASSEVEAVAAELGRVVIKVQVPVGGRGKAGGIQTAESPAEAVLIAERLFGSSFKGFPVNELLVEEAVEVEQELYAGVITDTDSSAGCPLVMLSAEGGVEIEELARTKPGAIHMCHVDPRYGLQGYQARSLVRRAGVPAEKAVEAAKIIGAMYEIYRRYEGELVEVNPLALTASGRVLALDGKVRTDSSADFRHPDLKGAQFDSIEAVAARMGLAYVELDGDIGIISNGAGLTMATMDHLALMGGRPANFMDTGERILRQGIPDGLGILACHPKIKVAFINVFGGGVRCDLIAQKIIDALRERPDYPLPVVACLQGRFAAEGRQILDGCGLPNLILKATTEEAVPYVIALAGGGTA